MAISSRLIKRRIRSVANTRKITKAMELVAASKMRKSAQLTVASRPYTSSLKEMVSSVRKIIEGMPHPLLRGKATSQSLLLIIAASDRGLCGGFNAQLIKKTFEFLRQRPEKDIRLITVGKRVESAARRSGFPIVAAFESISNAPHIDRTRPMGDLAYTEFMEGRADRIFLAYTDYRSAVSQIPTVTQLLPMTPETELIESSVFRHPRESGEPSEESEWESELDDEKEVSLDSSILFEPSPQAVLDALLPRLLEMQVYQSLLESSASEHAARMMAMRNATDNASDMLQDLTLTFNQARQASITREISEISAGKAAIE